MSSNVLPSRSAARWHLYLGALAGASLFALFMQRRGSAFDSLPTFAVLGSLGGLVAAWLGHKAWSAALRR